MNYEVPAHMSVSQRDEFLDCSWKYALKRVLRVPEQPGIAAISGKAFHLVTELIDHQLEAKRSCRESSASDVVKFPLNESTGQTKQGEAAGSSQVDQPRAELYDQLLRQVVRDIDWGKAVDVEAPLSNETAEAWHLALSVEVLSEMERNNLFPDPKDWKAAGRVSKALPAGEDLSWWTCQGAMQLQSYLRWRATSGWQLAFFGSEPMIELDVSCSIAGIGVEGYLDRIFLDTTGLAVLVDIKTGSREPGSTNQLGTYKLALETLGLPTPTYGAYYMSRDGEMGRTRSLARFTPEFFAWQYGKVKEQRDAGSFVANDKSSFCGQCAFREHCYAVGGRKAVDLPMPWQMGKPQIAASIGKR